MIVNKKIIASVLAVASVLTVSAGALADDNITVTVNGNNVSFVEITPFIENDHTLVPMREIFEALGADVQWDNETRTVISYDSVSDVSITMQIDSDVMYVYKHIILDMPTAEETLYWEEQRKEYLEFEQLHLIMLDSLKKIHLYEDSLRYVHYLDTLSGQAKLEYLIWHDSTLVHMDGRMRTVAIADDGYRFDTLSNEDLINRFQMLNFDSLMELKIKSTFEINSNVQIVYMHKITQILGDRFLNHSLDPNDPKLKQALDRFDEFVVKLFDSEGFVQLSLQSEITVCYERLWLLIEPYMLARIDSCKSILVLDANVWHYMMDETRVKYLHDKAQEAIIKGDLKKAKCYIRPMEAFTLNAQPTLTALPPRRHAVRNIEISYDWYEKYHLPILEKLGLR